MAGFKLFNRAKRLFQYGDLDNNESSLANAKVSATTEGGTVTIEQFSSNNSSSNVSNMSMTKRKKKTMIVISAVCFVAAVIIISMTVQTRRKMDRKLDFPVFSRSVGKKAIRLSNITDESAFYPSYFNGTWISDYEILYTTSDGGLNVLNAKTLERESLFSAELLYRFRPLSWKLSADKKYILFEKTRHSLYRRSAYGQYQILKLNNGRTIFDLKPSNMSISQHGGFNVRLVSWAPVGNGLAYVDMDNNIYYRESVLDQDTRLTATGRAGLVYNGIPDWVFEEEVLEEESALWWSPDGRKLAWGSFDDSEVDLIFLTSYGSFRGLHQYPTMQELRYPKVGRPNPKVELWLAELQPVVRMKRLAPPTSITSEAHFSWVTWADEDNLAVHWLNRVQNHTVLSLCKVDSLDCEESFSMAETDGWVDYTYRVTFNPRKGRMDFLIILPDKYAQFKFRQIVHVTEKGVLSLTPSKADVIEILKWSAEDNFIYYISTLPKRPGSRHLFRVLAPSENGKVTTSDPECITCNNGYLDRGPCGYVSIDMSPGGSFYVVTCRGPNLPFTILYHTGSHRELEVLSDNSNLEDVIEKYDMPFTEIIEVPVPTTTQKAQVRLYYPPNFDEKKKYPLVMEVYGGPGAQKVKESWNQFEFQTYLSGSQDVIYAIVDPRGSGFQGDEWKFAVYKKFGKVEVADTIHVAKYLQREFSYVDMDRTALWGWSYGGFLSLTALSKDVDNVFACGASVAPVVDWRLYDTYYTERYMGLMTENIRGYNESSVVWYLENLRHKRFYLMHGTKDDNVHFQQSMILSSTLEQMDILFRQTAYVDENHSIRRFHRHLYHSLTDFFINDCFARVLE